MPNLIIYSKETLIFYKWQLYKQLSVIFQHIPHIPEWFTILYIIEKQAEIKLNNILMFLGG